MSIFFIKSCFAQKWTSILFVHLHILHCPCTLILPQEHVSPWTTLKPIRWSLNFIFFKVSLLKLFVLLLQLWLSPVPDSCADLILRHFFTLNHPDDVLIFWVGSIISWFTDLFKMSPLLCATLFPAMQWKCDNGFLQLACLKMSF